MIRFWAVAVDADHRDARGLAGNGLDPRYVHSEGAHSVQQLRPEHIVANPAYHGAPSPHPGRRHRLVRALAPGVGEEPVAHYRLPGLGKPRGVGDQVHVDAAQHHYTGRG